MDSHVEEDDGDDAFEFFLNIRCVALISMISGNQRSYIYMKKKKKTHLHMHV